jgi:hypothetical protein
VGDRVGIEFEIGWVDGFSDFSNDLPNPLSWVRGKDWRLQPNGLTQQSNPSGTSDLDKNHDENPSIQLHIIIFQINLSFIYLPTISNSQSCAFRRKRYQISIVKIVELELKIEVKDDIKAAIIQASVKPRIAEKSKRFIFFQKTNQRFTIGH